jgi:hypothetical protein
MVRTTLLGLLVCSLVAVSASAQEGPLTTTVNVGVTSSYMWNGFNRVKTYSADNGPSVQPGVSVGMRNTGLSFNVGGSFVVNDNSELQETTYGVKFQKAVSPVVTVGAGYTYYDGRVDVVQGVVTPGVVVPGVDVNNQEVYGSVVLSNSVGVKPGVAVKYEVPSVDGADAYAVVVGSVDYSLPVRNVTASGVTMGVDVGAGVVYNSGLKVSGVDVSGVSAVTLGVKVPVTTGRVVVTPAVNYQVTTEDAVKQLNGQDSTFWAGVGVSFGF